MQNKRRILLKEKKNVIINKYMPEYFQNDLYIIDNFVLHMKKLNGNWSKDGIQRIIRLKSECSQQYVSLRNYRIRANVPIDEAFYDPYSKLFYFILF